MSQILENSREDDQSNWTPKQQAMMQWQWPITFGPFVLLILLTEFAKLEWLPIKAFLVLIFITIGWAVAFKGYLLYLTYQK